MTKYLQSISDKPAKAITYLAHFVYKRWTALAGEAQKSVVKTTAARLVLSLGFYLIFVISNFFISQTKDCQTGKTTSTIRKFKTNSAHLCSL